MSKYAPESSLKVAPDSPCITRVGDFLRRSGLDELPNLWNVARGDMALIGPRPEQFALLGYYQPWQHLRHLVKPGITGWWQIHHRDSQPMHLNIGKDIYYVRNQRLTLDLKIIVGTLKVLMSPLARWKLLANAASNGQMIAGTDRAGTADTSATQTHSLPQRVVEERPASVARLVGPESQVVTHSSSTPAKPASPQATPRSP